MKKVLILCTGNSCRSQMAEGWLRHFSPETQVYSAGTHPEGVNVHARHVMKVAGVDISNHTSNHVNDYMNMDFDYVITVCDNAKERCPYFPTIAEKVHESFPDPAGAKGTDVEVMKEYIKVRDMLKSYFKDFAINKLGADVRTNIFAWVEVPVLDFDRAKEFYEALLDMPIQEVDLAGVKHGFWSGTDNGVGGAIVKGEGAPSNTGPLVYFDGGKDLNNSLCRVNDLGGEVIISKTLISEEIGYYATFNDTEGNRLAFWSKN